MTIRTDKDAFDFVVESLLNQSQKSINKEMTMCHYRYFDDYSAKELKCAVGHLIDDDIYDSEMEGSMIIDDVIIESVKKSHPDWEINLSSLRMMQGLQAIHDQGEVPEWQWLFGTFQFSDLGDFKGVNINGELENLIEDHALCHTLRTLFDKD
jgi:hypothetical protein